MSPWKVRVGQKPARVRPAIWNVAPGVTTMLLAPWVSLRRPFSARDEPPVDVPGAA